MTELSVDGERDFFGNYAFRLNYSGYFESLNRSFVLQLGNNYVTYGRNDDARHIHVYDAVNKRAGLDGIFVVATNLDWNVSNDFYFFLFERPDVNGLVRNPSMNRLYGAIIEREGEVIRDYLPVRVGQVGYLYDRISGQLFGNVGSGEFILGPDV